MAYFYRRHFADQYILLRKRYPSMTGHICDICESTLAGLDGYHCNLCDFDIHEACANYFGENMSFFAHPWHTLKLSRMPSDGTIGWACDLCRESCPPGSFVYRCIQCKFDVHPLCTMLPQTIRSPLHPEHDLCMVPSWGNCSACRTSLPVWHYVCRGSCLIRLHIGCVNGGGQSNASSSQSTVVRPSKTDRVVKFILKQAFSMATGGSPLLDVLDAVLN